MMYDEIGKINGTFFEMMGGLNLVANLVKRGSIWDNARMEIIEYVQ